MKEEHKKKLESLIGFQMLTIFFVLFFVVFIVISFLRMDGLRGSTLKEQEMMLEDVVRQYENSKEGLSNNIALFEKDYFNRAEAVEYALQKMSLEDITVEELKKLVTLMQVNKIHLVSDDGVIIVSSSEESIGLNLRENKEASDFWKVIDGKEERAISIGRKSIITGEKRIFIGVKSKISGISVIQLDVAMEIYEKTISAFTIDTLIKSIPTDKEEGVFAVDATSGELLSITKNNKQELVFKEGETPEEFLKHLQKNYHWSPAKINGKYKYLTLKHCDHYIFGVWTTVGKTYNNAVMELIVMGGILFVILILIYFMLKRLIKKYILSDLENIDKTVHKVLLGDVDSSFDSVKSLELQKLGIILENWREAYNHTSERLMKLVERLNPDVAIFECIQEVNKVVFSSNICNLLEIQDETLQDISKDCQKFKTYINKIRQQENDEGYIKLNSGRYISIDTLGEGEGFYGVILDQTKELKRVEQVEEQMKRDSMTGLYNRLGLEEEMKKSLIIQPNQGIMMLFDLDNFKKVNDNEGHQAGDDALKRFGDCLRHCFRSQGIIARMGGDEFVVFIKDTLSEETIQSKCNLVLKQSRHALLEYYEKYQVSVSIGVAVVSTELATYGALYQNADNAMYMAKRLGKNTFYIYKMESK